MKSDIYCRIHCRDKKTVRLQKQTDRFRQVNHLPVSIHAGYLSLFIAALPGLHLFRSGFLNLYNIIFNGRFFFYRQRSNNAD